MTPPIGQHFEKRKKEHLYEWTPKNNASVFSNMNMNIWKSYMQLQITVCLAVDENGL